MHVNNQIKPSRLEHPVLLVWFLTLPACTFSHLHYFLSVTLFDSLAHFLRCCSITCFLLYWKHARTFSSLLFFHSAIVFHFLVLFLRVINIARFLLLLAFLHYFELTLFPFSTTSFPSYCLHSCSFSRLECYISVILFHFKTHLLGTCNIACSLSYWRRFWNFKHLLGVRL